MVHLNFILFVGSAFLSTANAVGHTNVSATSFCYDDPACGEAYWHGICNTGKQQSPIDIATPAVQGDHKFKWTEFEMNHHYLSERKHQFFAQNNGHTVRINAEHICDLRVCGGGLMNCYRFAQFHFHWDKTDIDGSEHTVDGQRFPMELHIVHYKEKFTSLADALASDENDALAVMAVFFKISKLANLQLSSIVMALERLPSPGDVLDFHLPLRISSFYPKIKQFGRYYGSLTTPTCDEKVIWTVFLKPIPISKEQMNKFRTLRNDEGVSDFNFRQIKPLNDRKIKFYSAGEFKNTF